MLNMLVEDFNQNWKRDIQKMNDNVMAHFSNFRNGMEILRQVSPLHPACCFLRVACCMLRVACYLRHGMKVLRQARPRPCRCACIDNTNYRRTKHPTWFSPSALPPGARAGKDCDASLESTAFNYQRRRLCTLRSCGQRLGSDAERRGRRWVVLPVQIWEGRAQSRCRCRRGESSLRAQCVQVLTELLLYYTRFLDLVKKSCKGQLPKDLVTIATLGYEVKQYLRTF